jgi:Bacterial mobilisation protein (MobC)
LLDAFSGESEAPAGVLSPRRFERGHGIRIQGNAATVARLRRAAKTRVSPEMKLQAKVIADREFLSEATWPKRLVIREIRARSDASGAASELLRSESIPGPTRGAPGNNGAGKPMLVRLTAEDRLLLDARAEARGMRPTTYASVLLRSHLRQLTRLPKDDLLALKRGIAALRSIGRNINQIARAANLGDRMPESVGAEFRAMLKICIALRDNTKALLNANLANLSGHRAIASRSRRFCEFEYWRDQRRWKHVLYLLRGFQYFGSRDKSSDFKSGLFNRRHSNSAFMNNGAPTFCRNP